MIVAVSMRVVSSGRYPEPRDAVSHDWTRLLDGLGLTPVFVPNVLASPARFLEACGARGLMLTGGDDLGPLPGEPGADGTPELDRDRTERALLSSAVERDLPVFGVCRGLQLINAHFGGALCRDVAPHGRHAGVRHETVIANAPGIEGELRIETNSFHNQGVVTSGVAPSLEVFARAGDVVEGVRHTAHRVIAVQWHPERDNPGRDADRRLLDWWIHSCA